MTPRHLLLGVTLSFLGVATLVGPGGPGNGAQVEAQSARSLHLSFQPFSGASHEAMPVEVLKFEAVAGTSDHLWVREWRLLNHSGKATVKMRLALFVSKDSEPDNLLFRRNDHALFVHTLGPGREWPKEACQPAKYCPHAFAIGLPSELFKPLAEGGEPEGSYRVALVIDKVWFADGTIWEFGTTKDN